MKSLLLILSVLLCYQLLAQDCNTNYAGPTFSLKPINPDCRGNTGSISVINLQNGVGPFSFRLVEKNITNSTGTFHNLAAGLYTIELTDKCGTVRSRQVTLVDFQFTFNFSIDRVSGCNDGEIMFDVTPAGISYEYGIISPANDTIWTSSHHFKITLLNQITVLVKDPCGNIQTKVWKASPGFLPYIEQIQHNLQCDKFDLFPVYYGFDNPTVCLYDYKTDKLIDCKQAPAITNFFDIPWGQYYIIVEDACFRDSLYKPNMESFGGSQIDPYNWGCNSFTMHVDGMEDTVCLYNAITNQLISCKGQDTTSINPRTGKRWPSGAVWDSLPYGSYYAWIYDPCEDSTFKIDSTVTYPFGTYLSSNSGCSLNQTAIQANFGQGTKKPFSVKVLNTDGSLNNIFTTNNNDNWFGVDVPPNSGPLTIIGSDACGYSDTASVVPYLTTMHKNLSVINKCPGVSGNAGSGDVNINTFVNNSFTPTPAIIKRNGVDTSIAASFASNNTFKFPNLPTGSYVFEYTFRYCTNMKYYDTVEIKDYVFPSSFNDTAIQCGGNAFSFSFPLIGGLAPLSYQVIDHMPKSPSLLGPAQNSPNFVVGNYQHYTSVKVRAVDFCGNSTIADIAIQPVQGCSTLGADTLNQTKLQANSLPEIYPNPAAGQFYLVFNQKKKYDYHIQVLNASGVAVYSTYEKGIDQKRLIIGPNLPKGFYIVRVQNLTLRQVNSFKQVVM